jgi:hypothetical protein
LESGFAALQTATDGLAPAVAGSGGDSVAHEGMAGSLRTMLPTTCP